MNIDFNSASRLKLIVWTLLVLGCLVFLSSIFTRGITLDDAYFAEQSYWFEKNGYVRSELFRGVLNWEERSFVYHKLHVWQGALLIKMVGWSPYLFKSLPILYLVIFIFLARLYFNSFITKDITVYYFFLFLLFVHTFISQYGFEFRPEIMIMTVGFASFFGIRAGLIHNRLSFIFLAGIMAGAAALFHLNGLIFIIAGMGLLVFNKAYRPLLFFIIASALIFSLYFLELIPGENLSQYLYQFRNDPAINKDRLDAFGWLIKVVTAPKRHFSHVYEASFTILFLFALILNWKEITKNIELKQVLIYLLCLELTLSLISPGSKTMYLTYYIPYMLIVISSTLYLTLSRDRFRKTFFFLLFLFAVTHIGHTYRLSSKMKHDMPDTHAVIVEKYGINRNHNILAPENFIFNEIHNAKIQGFTSVMLSPGVHVFSSLENLLDFADQHNKDYVIIEDDMLAKIGNHRPRTGTAYSQYQLVGIEEGLYVFRTISN
jgi:hypothetical protein